MRSRIVLSLTVLIAASATASCASSRNDAPPPELTGGLLTVAELRELEQAQQDSIQRAEEMAKAEANLAALHEALRDSASADEQQEVLEPAVTPTPADSAAERRIQQAIADTRNARTEQTDTPQADQPRESPFFIGDDVMTRPSPRPERQRPDTSPTTRKRRISPRSENPPRISVTFSDTPIEDVVAAFATWSGRSILVGEGASNTTVTADIYAEPWHIALETILSTNGLEPLEDPETGIISIRNRQAAREAEEHERPAPDVYKISYAEASEIASVLGEVMGERVQVTQVESTNSLLISASPEILDEVESLIAKLDVRQPTVTIQAQIISIARSEMESLGFRYSLEDPSQPYDPTAGGTNTGSSGLSGMPQVIIEPSGSLTNHPPLLLNRKGNATFATFVEAALSGTPYSLTAFVDALQGMSMAEVHAAPVITTISDKAASIEVGDAFHVPTLVTSQSLGNQQGGNNSGGQSTVGGSRDVIRVGISLDVTPHVTNNGKVRLEISAKRSGGEIDAGGTVKETFQSGQTEMIVDNGETAVIGGLTLTETSSGHTGVPILKDLPLIGRLFRTESRVKGERDLIILVTPTILYHEDDGFTSSAR